MAPTITTSLSPSSTQALFPTSITTQATHAGFLGAIDVPDANFSTSNTVASTSSLLTPTSTPITISSAVNNPPEWNAISILAVIIGILAVVVALPGAIMAIMGFRFHIRRRNGVFLSRRTR
ncbi:hypothetical protein GQ44DRAFT_730287 [Phaeosphaeriaceae sp. PMI808]|nr:hypothetical protein GQ44DRAFT_730287 [Phaeosphaeriaceae sp. PMI808]